MQSELPFPLLRRGKVRDVYDLGEALLMVASDRVSAFDVVMAQPVPGKGEILTLLSAWWFKQLDGNVAHHLLAVDPDEIETLAPQLRPSRSRWTRRAMLVRKLEPIPVECVVRGYICGSAWKEYATGGTLAGEPLPTGLEECGVLERPIFSPATKATEGHDENIPFARMRELLGTPDAERLRDGSVGVYEWARDIVAQREIILADTKFEWGRDSSGEIRLMDEVLTPDSSRFWPRGDYAPGRAQPSLDKQPLRDYLEELTARAVWNKQPPPPTLPEHVLAQTAARYRTVFQLFTGYAPEDFPLPTGFSE